MKRGNAFFNTTALNLIYLVSGIRRQWRNQSDTRNENPSKNA